MPPNGSCLKFCPRVVYRDPVATWTSQLGTSPADPLEAHIDPAPRNQ